MLGFMWLVTCTHVNAFEWGSNLRILGLLRLVNTHRYSYPVTKSNFIYLSVCLSIYTSLDYMHIHGEHKHVHKH